MTDSSDREVASGGRNVRPLVVFGALTALLVGADQGTKILALENLQTGVYQPLLGDIFGLQLVFNPGAAFSFATGMTWLFTVLAVIVAVVIIAVAPRVASMPWAIGLGLLLGGNVGNLIDRLFREPSFGQGHVVDFLNYGGLFIGNVADIAIVLAAPFIAFLLFRGINLDGTRHTAPASDDAATGGDDVATGDDDAETGGDDVDNDSEPETTPKSDDG